MAITPRVINVSSGTQLNAAIKTLKGGETILLAPGNYGNVMVLSKALTQTVTIKSANPSNDAVFSDLRINNSSGFRFEDIDIHRPLRTGEKDSAYSTYISSSSKISLVGVDFAGSLDGNSWNDGVALRVTNVRDMSVVDSTFTQLNNSAIFQSVKGLVVAGNTVFDVREGFNFADVHAVTIAQNKFTGFTPNLAKLDHSDSIQFWTSNVEKGSSDVVIRDNVITHGANGGTQGIYVASSVAGVRHSNFTIENNFYHGDARHGITVSGVDGATIKGNTVLSAAGGALETAINVYSSSKVSVLNNIMPMLLQQGTNTGLVERGNIDVWDTAQRKGIALDQIFQSPPKTVLGPHAFALKSSGSDAGFHGVAGVGADQFDLGSAVSHGVALHGLLGAQLLFA